jgi:hypothetical protein
LQSGIAVFIVTFFAKDFSNSVVKRTDNMKAVGLEIGEVSRNPLMK